MQKMKIGPRRDKRAFCTKSFNYVSHHYKLALVVKGALTRHFELFWPHTKLPLNGWKLENNYSLIR